MTYTIERTITFPEGTTANNQTEWRAISNTYYQPAEKAAIVASRTSNPGFISLVTQYNSDHVIRTTVWDTQASYDSYHASFNALFTGIQSAQSAAGFTSTTVITQT